MCAAVADDVFGAAVLWIIARGGRNVGPKILGVIIGGEWMSVLLLHAAHAALFPPRSPPRCSR